MKIKDILKRPSGLYIAEKLLNKDRSYIILHEDKEVSKDIEKKIHLIDSGYPIEYLFKEVYFYKYKFFIEEGVLIPRDDTEILIKKAIEIIHQKNITSIIDCCTGSGIIAITIAKETNIKDIVATDINEKAIEITKKNASFHKVDIKVIKTDLFNSSTQLLIANPPYVEHSHQKPNKYEPDLAFFAGKDGLDIIKRIVKKAIKFNIKYLLLEIGYNQKDKLENILKQYSNKFQFFRDDISNIRAVFIDLT